MMNRTEVSPKVRDLAQRLLSLEVAGESLSEAKMPAAVIVSEKLRRPLSRLAGTAGFRSLLVRAWTLKKREVETLDESMLIDIWSDLSVFNMSFEDKETT
jgi:hypothetical protein